MTLRSKSCNNLKGLYDASDEVVSESPIHSALDTGVDAKGSLLTQSEIVVHGAWTSKHGGGHLHYVSWRDNPQYNLSYPVTAHVRITLTQHGDLFRYRDPEPRNDLSAPGPGPGSTKDDSSSSSSARGNGNGISSSAAGASSFFMSQHSGDDADISADQTIRRGANGGNTHGKHTSSHPHRRERIGFYVLRREESDSPSRKLVMLTREHFVSVSQFTHSETVSCEVRLPRIASPYVIMPITSHPNVIGSFTLRIESSVRGGRLIVLGEPRNIHRSPGFHGGWYETSCSGMWSASTAGGCRHHITWRNNTQYELVISRPTNVIVSLSQREQAALRGAKRDVWPPTQKKIRAALSMQRSEQYGPGALTGEGTTGGHCNTMGMYIVAKRTRSNTRKMRLAHNQISAKTLFMAEREIMFRGKLESTTYNYRLIPATLAPGELGEYVIYIWSDVPVTLTEVTEPWTCSVQAIRVRDCDIISTKRVNTALLGGSSGKETQALTGRDLVALKFPANPPANQRADKMHVMTRKQLKRVQSKARQKLAAPKEKLRADGGKKRGGSGGRRGPGASDSSDGDASGSGGGGTHRRTVSAAAAVNGRRNGGTGVESFAPRAVPLRGGGPAGSGTTVVGSSIVTQCFRLEFDEAAAFFSDYAPEGSQSIPTVISLLQRKATAPSLLSESVLLKLRFRIFRIDRDATTGAPHLEQLCDMGFIRRWEAAKKLWLRCDDGPFFVIAQCAFDGPTVPDVTLQCAVFQCLVKEKKKRAAGGGGFGGSGANDSAGDDGAGDTSAYDELIMESPAAKLIKLNFRKRERVVDDASSFAHEGKLPEDGLFWELYRAHKIEVVGNHFCTVEPRMVKKKSAKSVHFAEHEGHDIGGTSSIARVEADVGRAQKEPNGSEDRRKDSDMAREYGIVKMIVSSAFMIGGSVYLWSLLKGGARRR